MSSPVPSSSSSASSGTIKESCDLFEDLWAQLKECHKNALQELEAKVNKLKKGRCLDAQRLEEFYSRNQQLKESQKGLQDTIDKLKERLLLMEVCARCAPLEEQVRQQQTDLEKAQQQNALLTAELKNVKDSLQDENRKLSKELEKLKSSGAQDTPPSEQEEGMIPDSPLQASAMPVVNKLKRRKTDSQAKHVRYKEKPLPPLHTSLFSELNKESLEILRDGGEMLVPNTCEMDTSQTSQDPDAVVAETCRLDVPKLLVKEEHGSSTPPKHDKVPSRAHRGVFSILDDTGASPSLLPSARPPQSGDGALHKAKRRKEKEDVVQEVEENKKTTIKEEEEEVSLQAAEEERVTGHAYEKQPTVHKQKQMRLEVEEKKKIKEEEEVSLQAAEEEQVTGHISKKQQPTVHKVLSVQNGPPAQKPEVSFRLRPANKTTRKSNWVVHEDEGSTQSILLDLNAALTSADGERKAEVDQTWSIDLAAALSQYHSPEEEGPHYQAETVDPDCTFISLSMLQGRGTHTGTHRRGDVSGHHQKANDSLDEMFDTTVCGEYKSYNSLTHLDHGGHSNDEEEMEEEEHDEHGVAENPGDDAKENKAGHPTYAHMAVVRNKDERRKLKGSTCKECDIYYADLPEEERKKKLSACSRHRFRYIPPSTPENFWEVGFPSTQTCVERGYIKEDKNPEPRIRRRQPFSALFSPKQKEQESS